MELASACSEKACYHAVILHAHVRFSSVVLRVCLIPGEWMFGSTPLSWFPLLPTHTHSCRKQVGHNCSLPGQKCPRWL